MIFEFFRFRFYFRSMEAMYFPPDRAGNIVRGAFGAVFRKLVCVPGCTDAKSCPERMTCPYARIFEPRESRGKAPSGMADWPRPFVIRAANLDGRSSAPGETFHFDIHLFEVRDPALRYFVQAFARLAQEGLGPGRAAAELVSVDQLDERGTAVARVFEGDRPAKEMAPPNRLDLAPGPAPVQRVRVRFATPTELKTAGGVADRPDFGVLFARLRDRVAALSALYGAGAPDFDFRGMGDRASSIRMTQCKLEWRDIERVSSRTGQRHPLGGLLGEVEYEGDLAEFIPFLRAGRWTGVGRQTVWGKGEFHITPLPNQDGACNQALNR